MRSLPGISLWMTPDPAVIHLRVKGPTKETHLDPARAEVSFISNRVLVLHGALNEIADFSVSATKLTMTCLKPSVGVVRSADGLARPVFYRTHVINHEERIKDGKLVASKRPPHDEPATLPLCGQEERKWKKPFDGRRQLAQRTLQSAQSQQPLEEVSLQMLASCSQF